MDWLEGIWGKLIEKSMVCVGTGKYSMCLYAFTIEIKLLSNIQISCSWYICMLHSVLVFGKIEKARMAKSFEC